MNPIEDAVGELALRDDWTYGARTAPAAEPTALAALALAAHQQNGAAHRARRWLAEGQAQDGSVGIRHAEPTPGWPTPLAVLAWTLPAAVHPTQSTAPSSPLRPAATGYDANVERAVVWMLATQGENPPQPEHTGHDTTLLGWPWVVGTHAWVEPTALALLALKAAGRNDHPRAREAARLLVDRLLPHGGCNYGNTIVLGQELLPHLQPTGVALLALAGERDASGRVERSLGYLSRSLTPTTATASLAWSVLALAAHDRAIDGMLPWLGQAAARELAGQARAPALALAALASLGAACPLVTLARASRRHHA